MALQNDPILTGRSGEELTKHGSAAFPCACYRDDLEKEVVIWHWHDELEAVVVTEGSALLAAGAVRMEIRAGDGYFLNSGVLHSSLPLAEGKCTAHSVVFHPQLIGGGMDSVFWQRYLRPLLDDKSLGVVPLDHTQAWGAEAAAAVETAWNAGVNEGDGYEFTVREALSRLVFLLTRQSRPDRAPPSEKAARDQARLKRMLQYIEMHFFEEITVEQIAQAAAVSKSECLRCFRGVTGAAPIQYVKQYRLQRAAELLASTDRKISSIAVNCGFRDMGYFSKAFRETNGCTPGEYRKGTGRQG